MYYLDLVKKYFVVVRILAVALVAFLSANAVSIGIRGRLTQQPTVDLVQVSNSASAFTSLDSYEIVIKRSLFNSETVDMEGGFSKNQSALIAAEDFELLGTLAGGEMNSMAIIRTRSDSFTGVYEVGEWIGKQVAQVISIQPRIVELMHNDQRKVIRMPDTPLPSMAGLASRWSKTGAAEAIAEGIKKLADGEFEIDRGLIDDAFENMGSLMRGARIVPSIENGNINGFKVFRIKKNSLYEKIGLKNGDILHRLNSVEIKGPEDGLRLFQELRSAKNISIDLTRGGQRTTLNYNVR
ncbi:MAG TPA: type II secretion system protein GspC [bacterium]|nr:type II secretion system protein GspC [bacterium]